MNLLALLFSVAVALPPIVPHPQSLTADEDRVFEVKVDTTVVLADDATEAERAQLTLLFQALGHRLPVSLASRYKGSDGAIFIGEPGRHEAMDRRSLRRVLRRQDAPGAEGYRLAIERDTVLIAGADRAGTYRGLTTLAQIAADGAPWPELTISDAPDLARRGVILSQAPDPAILHRLAKLKCNAVIFDHDDFYDMEGSAVVYWKEIFALTRSLHMEPIPMIRTLGGAEALVTRRPAIAETRIQHDRLVLRGDTMEVLGRRRFIQGPGAPFTVTVSGIPCRPKEDYALDQDTLLGGLDELSLPWTIRRLPGGAIPDGATVEAEYLYAPEEADAVSFSAPTTKAALQEIMAALVSTLQPQFIHIAHNDLAVLTRDGWARRSGISAPMLYAQSITLLDEAAKAAREGEGPRLVMWADGLSALAEEGADLEALSRVLPRDLVVHFREGTDRSALDGIVFAEDTNRSPWLAPAPDEASVYALCSELAGAEADRNMILEAPLLGAGSWPIVELALEKAWSVQSPISPWPHSLNRHVSATLWQPDGAQVREALITHLNAQTLRGLEPSESLRSFRDEVRAFDREASQGANEAAAQALAVYEGLAEYLDLEQRFARGNASSAVYKRLTNLIEQQAALNGDWSADRTDRIVEVVTDQKVFVPSTILFGAFLLPYRPTALEEGSALVTWPGAPAFSYGDGAVHAEFNLPAPLAVARADFETAQSQAIALATGSGATLVEAGKLNAGEGGIFGPVLVEPVRAAGQIRLTAQGTGDHTVLRSVRIHAIKKRAPVRCRLNGRAPRVDGFLEGGLWSAAPSATAFLRLGEGTLAEGQCTVQVMASKSALHIAMEAHEERMDTMAPSTADHDGALRDGESLELRLENPAGDRFRFAVSPAGGRYESRNGDVFWDGPWEAATRRHGKGWIVELTVPFATLGATPETGATWPVNFLRRRANVVAEESSWAATAAGRGSDETAGQLRFGQ
jgi:hypothetical protein